MSTTAHEAVTYEGHDHKTRKAFIVETPESLTLPTPDEAEAATLAKFGYPAQHKLAGSGLHLEEGQVILSIVDPGTYRWSSYLRRATKGDDGVYRRLDGNYKVHGHGSNIAPDSDNHTAGIDLTDDEDDEAPEF